MAAAHVELTRSALTAQVPCLGEQALSRAEVSQNSQPVGIEADRPHLFARSQVAGPWAKLIELCDRRRVLVQALLDLDDVRPEGVAIRCELTLIRRIAWAWRCSGKVIFS